MRRTTWLSLLGGGGVILAGAAALGGNGTPLNPNSANVLTLAVYGDAPYGTTPTDTSEFEATPAFIDNINGDPKVDLVLHIGDIHSGKQYCTEAYDRGVFDLWTAFKDPLIYTPGDNEWTDCHKAAEGGGTYNKVTKQIDYVLGADGKPVDYANGDPLANLDLVRSIFYPNPGVSLGGRKKQVLTQAQEFDPAHPADANYVENVMWEESKVLFVTVNLPGGSNNDDDNWYGTPTKSPAQAQEAAERTAADLRWLDKAFAQAQADGAHAVLIGLQADMWDNEKGAGHQTFYEPIVKAIADHTLAFGKPVLLINGDSHVYRSDNPLSASDPLNFMHPLVHPPTYDVPNFHRIVVHGSTFPLEWLRLTIDPQADAPNGPNAFGPFSWEQITQ
jgi:Calcineurin-like phosphoesterase